MTLDEGSLTINGDVVGVQPSGFFYWQPGDAVMIQNNGVSPIELFVGRIVGLTRMDVGSGTLAQVDFHHLMDENSAVEIYRVIIPPGAGTGQHHHSRKGMAFIVSGGKSKITFADGKSVVHEFGGGIARWQE
ncbi:MAG: hypothetical protein JKY89_09775 [Immundisolibacteraceae bacterium]|nr:hypothetical protein [Immundisolibacteraceae bacterium]